MFKTNCSINHPQATSGDLSQNRPSRKPNIT